MLTRNECRCGTGKISRQPNPTTKQGQHSSRRSDDGRHGNVYNQVIVLSSILKYLN